MNERREQLPTIREVAQAAGVSVGSVSRVLNAKESVSPEVRAKVEKAIQALGYKPNLVAQTMRSQISRTIACLIRDIDISGFAKFARAADDVLSRAGYALLLSNHEGRIERERELISVIAARRADALLIAQSSETDKEFGELLRRTGIPVVLIDRELPEWADAVMIDHRGGVRQATDKLIRLGHRRIALLTGRRSLFPARERIIGYEQAHAAAGLAVDPRLLRMGSFEADFAFEETSMLVSATERPTAIIAGGIEMLPGIVRALRVRGLSIPADMSVVAAMNTDLTDLFDPPLSVEDWDYAEVGRIAANLALQRIASGGSAEPRRVLVPTRFVLRESCAAPRG
ncbi:MAG: LacI family DNA-binding transcriptional regulator [Thalassobaculales bacterium]